MNKLVFTPAYQLARMIKEGQVSAVEVTQAYLNQISQYNSQLNAVCTLNPEALETAKQADAALAKGENWGALHGVPITIKDTFETAGLRTTAGYEPLKDYIPTEDATAVARLRAAGAIILGKTSPSQLAGDYQGINDLFPRVNNPWNLEYTSGGSSSGGAAAVCAGLSPLDLASDNGGSIRQPAHFCGLYGLKPTDRRVPTTGHIGDTTTMDFRCIRQMFTVGCLARSIEDLSLCIKLIAGADARQPDIPPVPLDIEEKSLENLRIAWIDQIPVYPVAEEIKFAMQGVRKKLADALINVESWVPKYDFAHAWEVFYAVGTYNLIYTQPTDLKSVREQMAFLWREATQGDKSLRKISKVPNISLPIFLQPSLKGYFAALTKRDNLIAQMDRELEQWDVLLCPVAMTTAFTHRAKGAAIEIDGKKVPYQMANGAYIVPFNLTGHPVVVIPIGFTKDVPIGMQIVGKRWKEMELLSIAGKLDRIIGGFRLPDY
ncbi:amidase [Rivularia sp. UHCC 0363]|uniref:amidase n=1 Tax=Rivularia sp. UHCC 0363 TaxID=3110244 RepID=UPI002B1E9C13|nr:amidase [Rivularia sp. UHCC 0363]MEA5595114.1 amidase [Rivularia sp. UHCC 0363]